MKEINLEKWNRKEIYDFFSMIDFPFYSVTIPIEVTNVKKISKEKNISFYHLMIWLCTKSINSISAFRQRIIDNKLYVMDITQPSFTIMKKNDDIFKIITVEWNKDYCEFDKSAKTIYNNQSTFIDKNETRDDLIYISSTPWFNFTSLTNERNFDKSDTIPRITWGQYYLQDKKLMMNISIDVNHRTIDGYHIGEFKRILDEEISKLNI